MKIEADSPEEYIGKLPQERKEPINQLRAVIKANLSPGFEETMNYGMIGYVVPHSLYPAGYHVNPELPLPFINLASQKNFIGLYHMGIYADENLLNWFQKEYSYRCAAKLDMGKSCIRFKKIDDIPYGLVGELASRMSLEEWITLYESKV